MRPVALVLIWCMQCLSGVVQFGLLFCKNFKLTNFGFAILSADASYMYKQS